MLDELIQEYGITRGVIIYKYIRLRKESPNDNMVRALALNLGYAIDRNKTNTFIKGVIKDFVEDKSRDRFLQMV